MSTEEKAEKRLCGQIYLPRVRKWGGTSLVFHIVFSVLGVSLPLMLCIAEGLALWKKDATWMALSRQWTKAFAILFAIGPFQEPLSSSS